MYRHLALASSLLALLMASGPEALAKNNRSFVTAVGAPGSASFAFGTELWALSQIELLPRHQICLETVEVPKEADRLIRLREGRSQFALVRNEVPTSLTRHARAVMALWPNGIGRAGAKPTQLLVRADVPDDVVYRVTDTLFEHAPRLASAHATMDIGSPREAMVGLSVPIHPGAYRYYEEHGLGFDQASRRPDIATGPGALDEVGLRADEAQQLAAACGSAAAHETLGLIDRDDWVDVCGAYAADRTAVELIDPANGQGGPRLPAHHGGGQASGWRGDPRSKMPGRKPTM